MDNPQRPPSMCRALPDRVWHILSLCVRALNIMPAEEEDEEVQDVVEQMKTMLDELAVDTLESGLSGWPLRCPDLCCREVPGREHTRRVTAGSGLCQGKKKKVYDVSVHVCSCVNALGFRSFAFQLYIITIHLPTTPLLLSSSLPGLVQLA